MFKARYLESSKTRNKFLRRANHVAADAFVRPIEPEPLATWQSAKKIPIPLLLRAVQRLKARWIIRPFRYA